MTIKKLSGRPAKKRDEDAARRIRLMCGLGLTMEKIALVEHIDPKTMRKLYRAEMDAGAAEMEAKLAQTAYQMALEEHNPALIMFLLKTRYGYRETNRQEVEISARTLQQMTDAELMALAKK